MNIRKLLFKKESLAIIAVVFMGLALRLYHFQDLFYYTMDEEVMNLIQRQIVLGQHYPLIGSVSPLGTYLGPIFYYVGALILALSGLNPLGQSFVAIVLGTFNIWLIYKISKSLFNARVGLITSTLYAGSFLMVIFDRRFWHLTPGPLLSLLVLWSIYKIKVGNLKYVYLLVAALIFGWNTDYTNLILFLFTGLAWLVFRLPVWRKEVFLALMIFLVSNLPLVLFDLRHDFLNSKAFINYFRSSHRNQASGDRETLGTTREEQAKLTGLLPLITFSRVLYTASLPNISEQHTYCKTYIFDRNSKQGWLLPALAGLIIGSFIFLTIKHRKAKNAFSYKVVLAFYLIFQLGVLLYAFLFRGDVFEHYLATLLSYFFIMGGVVVGFVYSKLKFPAIGFMVLFVGFNSYLVFSAYHPFGFKDKLEATKFVLDQVGQSDFALESLGSCFRYDGYYYPFLLFGRHPVKSYQDNNYSWLYDYKVAEQNPGKIVVMVSRGRFEDQKSELVYNQYLQKASVNKQFGGLQVLIINN